MQKIDKTDTLKDDSEWSQVHRRLFPAGISLGAEAD
jgi:hypothetical protein